MTRPQVALRSEVARGLRASVCAATPRRGSLLYKKQTIARSVSALNIVAAIIAATFSSFASPHDGWREAKVAFLGDSITDARHIGCTSNYWNFLERDMLHPNNAGHEQIAHAIMRRLGCASYFTNP